MEDELKLWIEVLDRLGGSAYNRGRMTEGGFYEDWMCDIVDELAGSDWDY